MSDLINDNIGKYIDSIFDGSNFGDDGNNGDNNEDGYKKYLHIICINVNNYKYTQFYTATILTSDYLNINKQNTVLISIVKDSNLIRINGIGKYKHIFMQYRKQENDYILCLTSDTEDIQCILQEINMMSPEDIREHAIDLDIKNL